VNEADFRSLLDRAMDGVAQWEASFGAFESDETLDVPPSKAAAVIDELIGRLHENYPFFHPSYTGQMLKPPHPIALVAYAAAARINPNNHALDGGPATAKLEREAVGWIAQMFGVREPYLGHLTSSGTIANLEALWVASRIHPGKAVAFSAEAHYTHGRMADVLGVPTVVVPVDRHGRLDVDVLTALPPGTIGTVVATAGTTSCGAVDPVDEIVDLAADRGWRVHADTAYGGFFTAIKDVEEAKMRAQPWRALARCDSIVVDPHKHGLQPYGCGCVLFADPGVGIFYRHDSPYTYFTSTELHLGEISLECSRAGASAAALWATLRCLPLTAGGLGRVLLKTRQAALRAHRRAVSGGRLVPVVTPEIDIFTAAPARPGEKVNASTISTRAERLFADCASQSQARPLHLAKWRVPKAFGALALPDVIWDRDECVVIRSVLMKPEHAAAAENLVERLEAWKD
jgi:glutamate/tyrosine decarboxylase-like PLP-dependent enzyme